MTSVNRVLAAACVSLMVVVTGASAQSLPDRIKALEAKVAILEKENVELRKSIDARLEAIKRPPFYFSISVPVVNPEMNAAALIPIVGADPSKAAANAICKLLSYNKGIPTATIPLPGGAIGIASNYVVGGICLD